LEGALSTANLKDTKIVIRFIGSCYSKNRDKIRDVKKLVEKQRNDTAELRNELGLIKSMIQVISRFRPEKVRYLTYFINMIIASD